MRSALLLSTIFAFLFPCLANAQEGAKADIEVSSAVLKTAEWAGYKYMENLDKAKAGDAIALTSFFKFSGTVDGTEALQHATTCLELIPFATDEKVGTVIYSLKPNLQAVLLERFQLAQGRTKKEALLKPLQDWAPFTWKGLHGEKVICSVCVGKDLMTVPPAHKPGETSLETTEPTNTTGKQ